MFDKRSTVFYSLLIPPLFSWTLLTSFPPNYPTSPHVQHSKANIQSYLFSRFFSTSATQKSAHSKLATDFLAFLNASPSPFHAVDNAKKRLLADGYVELKEKNDWAGQIKAGGKYFLTRNQSAIIAFAVGEYGERILVWARHLYLLDSTRRSQGGSGSPETGSPSSPPIRTAPV